MGHQPKTLGVLLTTALLTFFSLTGAAHSVSWEEAIQKAEATAEEFYSNSKQSGYGAWWLGTASNDIGVREAECSILGRMLGKTEFIAELEFIEWPEAKPNMTWEEAEKVLTAARLFENWAYTAKRILRLSEAERITIWNVSCVGKMGIPNHTFMEEIDTTFRLDGDAVVVLGDIEEGFFNEFRDFLEANPQVSWIALGSSGGSVADAIQTGLFIREKGLSTQLYSDCLSACPLVFLGGYPRRIIWSPYPELGFQEISRNGHPVPHDDEVYGIIASYVQAMGANPYFVLQAMYSAPIEEMHFPELEALCDASLVTSIQRLCF